MVLMWKCEITNCEERGVSYALTEIKKRKNYDKKQSQNSFLSIVVNFLEIVQSGHTYIFICWRECTH